MNLLAVDITNHLQTLFNFIYEVYKFLNSIEFTAFGFNFSLLGILLGLIFLIFLVKFMKFGYEEGARAEISYRRAENRADKKAEGRNVLRSKR